MIQEKEILRNVRVKGAEGKIILLDLFIPKGNQRFPLLVFVHGFKGFKDWGHFNWLAEQFMQYGIAFCKFNFSHGGVNPDNPTDITDFETFGQNNYSKEIKDLGLVLDYLQNCEQKSRLETGNISVVGHSRGGATAVLRAVEDNRIKKLILWASPFNLGRLFRPATIEQLEKEGKVWVENKRTGDVYPLYKQFYDDFMKNKDRLDIPKNILKISIPILLIHGDKDETVDLSESEQYYDAIPHSILIRMDGAGHTFGATHPFDLDTCNDIEMLNEVVENTAEFIL
ncbi:MAG: alpha/beta fold hydrolase [Bacteroidia bacterium]|nr:alpha/beta fold hydrolase [Bacteroidia bacterium]MCO5254810.1 alpha/beta fold hydrolase [Bacteroidota bacterium]